MDERKLVLKSAISRQVRSSNRHWRQVLGRYAQVRYWRIDSALNAIVHVSKRN